MEKRFSDMQNHTAEHIVSGTVHALYGYDNVGFHMGEEEITMDFSGRLSASSLPKSNGRPTAQCMPIFPVEISLSRAGLIGGDQLQKQKRTDLRRASRGNQRSGPMRLLRAARRADR